MKDVETWQKGLSVSRKNNFPKDVFNEDETSVYSCTLPKETYALKMIVAPNRNTEKQRITILFKFCSVLV